MTVVAIWCRHLGDNIIGVDNQIPWCAPRDAENFVHVVEVGKIVCGRKTYESLPENVLGNAPFYVMTKQQDYALRNESKHVVINSQRALADLDEDELLYVIGGAQIYELFMVGKEKLKPHIVVDCVYVGELNRQNGEKITISSCVEIMDEKYFRISSYYKVDDVFSAIWVRKGEFVAQSELKRIMEILSFGAEVCTSLGCV